MTNSNEEFDNDTICKITILVMNENMQATKKDSGITCF